jgi:hypothetical protein
LYLEFIDGFMSNWPNKYVALLQAGVAIAYFSFEAFGNKRRKICRNKMVGHESSTENKLLL